MVHWHSRGPVYQLIIFLPYQSIIYTNINTDLDSFFESPVTNIAQSHFIAKLSILLAHLKPSFDTLTEKSRNGMLVKCKYI